MIKKKKKTIIGHKTYNNKRYTYLSFYEGNSPKKQIKKTDLNDETDTQSDTQSYTQSELLEYNNYDLFLRILESINITNTLRIISYFLTNYKKIEEYIESSDHVYNNDGLSGIKGLVNFINENKASFTKNTLKLYIMKKFITIINILKKSLDIGTINIDISNLSEINKYDIDTEWVKLNRELLADDHENAKISFNNLEHSITPFTGNLLWTKNSNTQNLLSINFDFDGIDSEINEKKYSTDLTAIDELWDRFIKAIENKHIFYCIFTIFFGNIMFIIDSKNTILENYFNNILSKLKTGNITKNDLKFPITRFNLNVIAPGRTDYRNFLSGKGGTTEQKEILKVLSSVYTDSLKGFETIVNPDKLKNK